MINTSSPSDPLRDGLVDKKGKKLGSSKAVKTLEWEANVYKHLTMVTEYS